MSYLFWQCTAFVKPESLHVKCKDQVATNRLERGSHWRCRVQEVEHTSDVIITVVVTLRLIHARNYSSFMQTYLYSTEHCMSRNPDDVRRTQIVGERPCCINNLLLYGSKKASMDIENDVKPTKFPSLDNSPWSYIINDKIICSDSLCTAHV